MCESVKTAQDMESLKGSALRYAVDDSEILSLSTASSRPVKVAVGAAREATCRTCIQDVADDGEPVELRLPIICRVRPAALTVHLPLDRPGVPHEPGR